jgi:GntR family transcriptional regulator/MocR family aminotransferase
LGATLTATRRLELLEWAQKAGAWLIEDDYDSEYRYDSQPIPSLQGLDRDSRVIYIGTFSKVLFPSLRLGYLVVPPDLVERFSAVRDAIDIFPPSLHALAVAEFISGGHFARHLRRTRMLYSERRDALVTALDKDLGGSLRVVGAEAGMHLTALLAKRAGDRAIATRAARDGLWAMPLSVCYLGARAREGLVLGYGGTSVADIPGAVRRLRHAIETTP